MGRIYQQSHILRDEQGNAVLGSDGKPRKVVRSAKWWISYYDANGKRHYESSGSDKITAARKLLTQREAAKDRGEPVGAHIGRITFDDAATDIINDYKVNAKRSLADVQCRIHRHLRPAFGGQRLTNITTSDIRAYTAARLEAKAAPASINRELAALKRMFTLALQASKLLHRPHIPMLRESNTRSGFFEREQFETVRTNMPEHLRPVITFAYLTGWRVRSEVLPLRLAHVDMKAGIVRLDAGTTKNDDPRAFHFNAITELRDTLTKQVAAAEARSRDAERIVTHVFHEPDGSPLMEHRLRKAWTAACEAAGCPGMLLHDFRRSAVRNLVRAGVPERVAMQLTGHKTRSVFERYNITSGADLTDAAQKLETFLTTKPTDAKQRGQVRQFKRRAAR